MAFISWKNQMGTSNKVCPGCGRKMKNRPDRRDDLQLYRLAAL